MFGKGEGKEEVRERPGRKKRWLRLRRCRRSAHNGGDGMVVVGSRCLVSNDAGSVVLLPTWHPLQPRGEGGEEEEDHFAPGRGGGSFIRLPSRAGGRGNSEV